MKKTQTLILISCLAASSAAFAVTGPTPRCTSGALNLAIYNKNLPSGDCYSSNGKGRYCIYNQYYNSTPDRGFSCTGGDGASCAHGESISFRYAPERAELVSSVYIKGGQSDQRLRLTYDHGVVFDNCAQVFGPEIKCVIAGPVVQDPLHKRYTLVISKR